MTAGRRIVAELHPTKLSLSLGNQRRCR